MGVRFTWFSCKLLCDKHQKGRRQRNLWTLWLWFCSSDEI